MSDVLGFDRFDQHLHWRATGHVDGNDVDEIEPREFVVQRADDRWLFTNGNGLVAVGDSIRDLVADKGGLRRYPVGRGFEPYTSACLLRQISMLSGAGMTQWNHHDQREATHAGRPALQVDLTHLHYEVTLGVDVETGVWTYLRGRGVTVIVDELILDPAVASAFSLLDLVPEMDFSERTQPNAALMPIMQAVGEASGLTTELMWASEPDGFRLILSDGEGTPQAFVTRRHSTHFDDAVFGGVEVRRSDGDFTEHIDTCSDDPTWAQRIAKALGP